MNIPNWYALILLTLASYRVYRLVSEDTILDRPRAWALGYTGWEKGQMLPATYRIKWGEFITCPWCAGFWISLLWWAAWLVWPHATTVVAVPLAVSALVGLVSKNLDRDET